MTIIQKGERMSDLISRQAAIDAVIEDWNECCGVYDADTIIHDVTDVIEHLPTVQPKRGKWYTENNSFIVLDVCDQCMKAVRHVAPFYDFCPHCGAKMER